MDTLNTPSAPPPPPEYYVLKSGQILGPFSIEELKQAVTKHDLAMSDFVQTGGIPVWRPISRVLGVDGSVPYGAVAPDWRSILTWAWLRIRYNIDEQSFRTGLICLAGALLTLVLARFSFILWLPWVALTGVAAVAMMKRRQLLPGVGLLVAACAIPVVVASRHFGADKDYRLAKEHGIAAANGDASSRPSAAQPISSDASPARELTQDELPPLAVTAPVEPLPSSPPPTPSSASPAPAPIADVIVARATPPPLAPVAESTSSVVPAATVRTVTTDAPPATTIATALPPPLPPALPPSAAPKLAPAPEPPALGGGDLVQRHRDSLIVIRDKEGAGSGFLCRKGEKVWLFTNNHVVAGMPRPAFTRLDGSRVNVGTAESASGYDAMRLAVTDPVTRPLESVTSLEGLARIDDDVVVLGNSGGGGVVTSIPGKLVGIGPDRIEVSAEFIPGNSGSPVIHVPSGKVIGIATYLTRKYEEFSSGGEVVHAPAGSAQPKGTLVTRRFAFRLDNIPRWEPVNWQLFQSEAQQLRQISALTEDIFDFLGTVRQGGSPQFATDTLRRPAQQWFDTIRKPRVSDADKFNATHSFLSSLRSMVRTDIQSAEAHFRYTFFREELAEERTVRDKLYEAFDKSARRLGSSLNR